MLRTRSVFLLAAAAWGVAAIASCGRTSLDRPIDVTGGAGMTTGRAGTGGRAGTNGAAGTSGKAGTTGKAGTGGIAGTGGNAGTGATGFAGVTGMGGFGGTGSTGVGGATGFGGTSGTECVDGKTRCVSAMQIQSCQGGKWAASSPCSLACISGLCAECIPGLQECSGPDTLRTCTAAGLWPEPAVCPSGLCSAGACRDAPQDGGMCLEGSAVCAGDGGVSLCTNGALSPPFACEHGCIGGVCAECTPGDSMCGGARVCTQAGIWVGLICSGV